MKVKELVSIFKKHANPLEASPMAAYMKHKFEYFGIKKTPRALLQKAFVDFNKSKSFEDVEEIALELFEQAERELHYVAIELLVKSKIYKHKKSIKLFERLITSHSWWDSVDTIASKLVGGYFIAFPEEKEKWISKWIKSDNLWLNRTAIIFQLTYKENLDINWLTRAILPHTNSKEFFHQKAIGWALRQYARTNPKWVKDFVKATPLKPLSIREALKHL